MRYKVGLYGGSFNPPHRGHVDCMLQAANQCEELYIVMCVGTARKEIDPQLRYRWLYQLTAHLPHVRIITFEDTCPSKEAYTDEVALEDCRRIRQQIGKPIDAVFFGDDYDDNSFWVRGYPDSTPVRLPRDEVSSTAVRRAPFSHWDWIPSVVRPYYVKKVLLIGGESTGKSTLTAHLAHRFCTNYIEEVGREISLRSGSEERMLPEDFTEILLRHKLNETEAIKTADKLLFIDTDALITRFYLQFLKVGTEAHVRLAEAIDALNDYDLILFLETDVPFVQDGTRSDKIGADRDHYSDRIQELFRRRGRSFHVLRGDYQERYMQAVSLVQALLEEGEE